MAYFGYPVGENDTSDIFIAMDTGKKHTRSSFTFKIEHNGNGTFVASIIPRNNKTEQDDEGALYYVIVVILLYGCSILMMIASFIRKNNVDRKLHRYLKDMASVRKREQQLQLFNAAAKAAAQTRKSICLGTEHSPDAQKWHGASHWSRANEEILAEEARRKRYVRRHSSLDSTEDERSRKPSDISVEELECDSQKQHYTHNWRQREDYLGLASSVRPSVRIICDPSDPGINREELPFDDRNNMIMSSNPAQSHVVMFGSFDDGASPVHDLGESNVALLVHDNDYDESQVALQVVNDDQDLDVDGADVQETEDSESDLFLGKSDQDSRQLQWLDFQVVSSV